MEIIILPLAALLSIGSLILFIIVLVKLFKTEGVLKGILGIICGIYPFIWGWIKHKQLKLTKIMAIWTGIMIVSILVQTFFAASAMKMALNFMNSAKTPGPVPRIVQRPVKRPLAKTPGKKAAKKITPGKTKPASPAKEQSVPKETVKYEFEMKRVNNLLQLNKENADALFNRGWLYEYKGDLKAAESDYTEAIQINKRHADAYYNRGLLFIKAKKFELAVKDFSETIKLKPRSFDAYCNRGNANFYLGKTDLAIGDYTQALKINPNDADFYYNRAVIYLANGEKPKAMNDFQKASNLGHKKAKEYLKKAEGTGPKAEG